MIAEKKIGFKQRVPALAFREALREFFPTCTIDPNIITELLAGYFKGEYVRYRSQLHISACLQNENLKEFFDSNRIDLRKACELDQEPLYICFALLCARYSFCYDIAIELSKLFRLQDDVAKTLIAKNISKKYGYNENVKRSMERFLAFCEEANIISRNDKSFFECKEAYTPHYIVTINLWKKVYLINEPAGVPEDESDLLFEPFFRYLKLF